MIHYLKSNAQSSCEHSYLAGNNIIDHAMSFLLELRWNDVFDLSAQKVNAHRSELLDFNKQKCLMIQGALGARQGGNRHEELQLILGDLKRYFTSRNLTTNQILYVASVLWYHHLNTLKYVQSFVLVYHALSDQDQLEVAVPKTSLIFKNLLSELRLSTQKFSVFGRRVQNSTDGTFGAIYNLANRILYSLDSEIFFALKDLDILLLWSNELVDSLLLKVCGPNWESILCYLIALSRIFRLPFAVVLAYSATIAYSFIHRLFCTCNLKLSDKSLEERVGCIEQDYKLHLQSDKIFMEEQKMFSIQSHKECAYLIHRSNFYDESLCPKVFFFDALRAILLFAIEDSNRIKQLHKLI